MKLYNVYLREHSDGILIKVGDVTRKPMDKYRIKGDQPVGYISGRNRAMAKESIRRIGGQAIANAAGILKQKPKNGGEE